LKLNQITIPVLDLDHAVAFYKVLGLQLIVYSAPHYARFHCPDGDATFSLQLVDALPVGHGIHVYFECDALDNAVEQLKQQGVQFDEMPNDKPWLWREAHLKDPDGNHIILYYAGENRLHPPWRIN